MVPNQLRLKEYDGSQLNAFNQVVTLDLFSSYSLCRLSLVVQFFIFTF